MDVLSDQTVLLTNTMIHVINAKIVLQELLTIPQHNHARIIKQYLSQHVHATNSITQVPTDVTHVKLTNSHKIVLLIKLEHANTIPKTAPARTKYNWTKAIAIDAKHVESDNHIIVSQIVALKQLFNHKYKDPYVYATNSITLLLTDVTTVVLANYQTILRLINQELAKTTFKIAEARTKYNWTKAIALDAKHAISDKLTRAAQTHA
jgi:hypothetical protein